MEYNWYAIHHPDPLHALYDLRVEIDFDIIVELDGEDWQSITPTHLDDQYTKRYFLTEEPKSKPLRDMLEYFNGIEFKKRMMKLIWDEPEFHQKWGPRLDYDNIFDITHVEAGFYKDVPGFYTDLHLENRGQLAFGMVLFLGDEDDPKRSTYFYTHGDKSSPVRIRTNGHGAGWICINNHKAWHEGGNKSDKVRYSMSINYCFNMFHGDILKPNDYSVRLIRGELD